MMHCCQCDTACQSTCEVLLVAALGVYTALLMLLWSVVVTQIRAVHLNVVAKPFAMGKLSKC